MGAQDNEFIADRMLILDASVKFLERHEIDFNVDDVIGIGIFLSGDAMPQDLTPMRFEPTEPPCFESDAEGDATE